ncbi:MAG: hypothetical protein C5B55_12530 [Blastocatellia bacterium]|nr:MAG: hypothetical protein C5B55_12530 [Blastocatellia bacterium]
MEFYMTSESSRLIVSQNKITRHFLRSLTVFITLIYILAINLAKAQSPDVTIAIVNDEKVTLRELDESIAQQIFPLNQQLYALRKAALSNLIAAKILEREAIKKGISVEDLRKQLMVGSINVTKAQVEEAYVQNLPLLSMMSPHEAKERLRLDLESQQRMKLYRRALEDLKQQAKITLLLEQPGPPGKLDDGLSPTKGARQPTLTIVEFSDFQCPYCRQVQPTLNALLDEYAQRVRVVFKYLPIESHANSHLAAEGAYCASEQERFWQFHDAIFASSEVSKNSLELIATNLGLNLSKFSECSKSVRPQVAIAKDLENAKLLGIESTPSFVIGDEIVNGAISLAEFKQIVDRKLSQLTSTPSSTK